MCSRIHHLHHATCSTPTPAHETHFKRCRTARLLGRKYCAHIADFVIASGGYREIEAEREGGKGEGGRCEFCVAKGVVNGLSGLAKRPKGLGVFWGGGGRSEEAMGNGFEKRKDTEKDKGGRGGVLFICVRFNQDEMCKIILLGKALGRNVRFLSIMEDVNERKRAEAVAK